MGRGYAGVNFDTDRVSVAYEDVGSTIARETSASSGVVMKERLTDVLQE
jgi:hypothetical protein